MRRHDIVQVVGQQGARLGEHDEVIADAFQVADQVTGQDHRQAALGLGNGNATYVGGSLNASYALGPGISLEGQVAWTRSSTSYSALSAQNKVNAYEIDIGTAVNF